MYFAGFNISPAYLRHLLDLIAEKELAVNIISKSGTTLEPALAFRIFRRFPGKPLRKKGAAERIIATTDQAKGVLRKLADEEGYETFSVRRISGTLFRPDALGLLPIAVEVSILMK